MDIMFTYEVFTERRAMLLYPINVLRNLARVQVRIGPSSVIQSIQKGNLNFILK